jgi:hypothetical protein
LSRAKRGRLHLNLDVEKKIVLSVVVNQKEVVHLHSSKVAKIGARRRMYEFLGRLLLRLILSEARLPSVQGRKLKFDAGIRTAEFFVDK